MGRAADDTQLGEKAERHIGIKYFCIRPVILESPGFSAQLWLAEGDPGRLVRAHLRRCRTVGVHGVPYRPKGDDKKQPFYAAVPAGVMGQKCRQCVQGARR